MEISKILSKKYLIFDFDKTIGTLQANWKTWHRQIGDIFREYDSCFNLDLKDKFVHSCQNDFFRKYGKELRDKILSCNEKFEQETITGFEPNFKVLKIIHEAGSQKLYIWSSNTSATLKKYLTKINLRDKFQKIISRNDVFYIKPNPEGFKYIFKPGKNLKDYLFIGDSFADKEAAKKAGIEYLDVSQL